MRSAVFLTALCSCLFVTAVNAEDPDEKIKIAHAVLGSVAWVFFFPLGSILIRLLHGSRAVWIHVPIQLFATALFTVNVGLGIRMALDKEEIDEYHIIIGLVLFGTIFVQAVLGTLNHLRYRKTHTRNALSYMHIWVGRALITLGMINGGLGLLLSEDAENSEYIAYGVVAGVVWVTWMAIDLGVFFKGRKSSASLRSDEKHLSR